MQFTKYSPRSPNEEINIGEANAKPVFFMTRLEDKKVVEPDPRYITFSMKMIEVDDKFYTQIVQSAELDTVGKEKYPEFFKQQSFATSQSSKNTEEEAIKMYTLKNPDQYKLKGNKSSVGS